MHAKVHVAARQSPSGDVDNDDNDDDDDDVYNSPLNSDITSEC